MNLIKEYGIAYAKNTEKESEKTFLPASELKDDYSFTVKITDLNPDVSYVYCAYVKIMSINHNIMRTKIMLGEHKILEKFNK